MRTYKALLAAACIVAALALSACDASGGSDDDGGEVVFLDQNLQGEFNGKAYTFVSGYAEESYFTAGEYDIDLYNIEPGVGKDPWDIGAYPFGGVYLKVMATVPAKVGRTDLYFDKKTWENKTVTLYDPTDNSLNILAHIGAVEITAIDTTAGTLTGRIAASNGEGDEVNGNFTVRIAPAD